VKNDAGIFFLTTPNTITIARSNSDLEVTCYVEELLPEDILSPETIFADENETYINHPFSCPLTETELFVKDQLEQNYQESILEEEIEELPEEIELPAEDLEPKEPVLTPAQINAIAQLDQLLAKKMISQETYEQEKTILLSEDN
jgi:deoxyribodipyrimidine photolyase